MGKDKRTSVFEIILIGAALSADAMSVTLVNMLANPNMPRSRAMLQPIAFGLFQGLMPLIGFFIGSLAAGIIGQFAGLVTFIILGVIGGKMVWDGFHDNDDEDASQGTLTVSAIVLQAIATSIDALAVGVSFAATGENIFFASGIIAICTFLLCLAVLGIGKHFGEKFGSRAAIVGGIVLIAIGVKALFF